MSVVYRRHSSTARVSRWPSHTTLALAVSLALGAGGRAQAHPTEPALPAVRKHDAATRDEYLFIDQRVARHGELEAAVRAGVKTFVIDPDRDGIAQISAALRGHAQPDAIHVVAHAAPGAMQLGASTLDAAHLDRYHDQMIAWFAHRNASKARPDLMLYGCNLAADAAGRALVARLASITGADVAASVDLTGGLALNANWNLELATGRIESTLPFERAVADAYAATLATLTVTSLADSGAGTLRDAIVASGAGDTIVFQSGLSGTITLTTGPLSIDHALTVTGPGAATISVNGNAASTVFVLDSKSDDDVTISGLTITNGSNTDVPPTNRPDGKGGLCGGGIFSNGMDLTLNNVVVSGNTADAGAGICFVGYDVVLNLSNSTVSGNTALYGGGGLYFGGNDGANANVTATTFSGNAAQGSSGGAIRSEEGGRLVVTGGTFTSNTASNYGGAIFIDDLVNGALVSGSTFTGNGAASGGAITFYIDYTGAHTLDTSTVSGNTATDNGGGVYFYGTNDGPGAVTNTTISGNTAAIGGGVYLEDPGTYACGFVNSTISGNTANAGSGGGAYIGNAGAAPNRCRFLQATVTNNSATATGGGIFAFTGELELQNSVVANNTPDDLGSAAQGGATFFAASSFIETPGTATLDTTGGSVTTGVDPNLGPLANNGGPTQTRLPLTGSPLINAGNNALATGLTTDQRGTGFPRIVATTVDIGAVEAGTGGAPVVFIENVPALDAAGRYGLALLCGALGVAMLRRRRGAGAASIALAIAIGAGGLMTATSVEAADAAHAYIRAKVGHATPDQVLATTVVNVARANGRVVIDLGNGQRFDVPESVFRVGVEHVGPRAHDGSRLIDVPSASRRVVAGENVVVKVRHDRAGNIERLKVLRMPDSAQAQALLRRLER